MIADVPSNNISDGLLNRIVESNTKLLNASLNPRKIQSMKRAITNKIMNAPIRLTRDPNLAMTSSTCLLKTMCVKKSQVEIATVTMLRISSPNEELNPKTKGDAYKFGLKSQPFMILAGNSISRHTNLTNHRERILTAVGIQSFRI